MLVQQQKKERRQEQILLSLDKLTYATREQMQFVNQLAGERNAQRILSRMEKDGLLNSVRLEKKIYYLSNRGKTLIDSNQGELKKSWIQHTLMRNDLYIFMNMPDDWQIEMPIRVNGEVLLIPDAIFSQDGIKHFVEVDNVQSMQTNNDKINKYASLSKGMQQQFGYMPVVMWYTLSETRKEKLNKSCDDAGLRYQIY